MDYIVHGVTKSDTTEQLSLSLWAITKNVTKTVTCFPFFPVTSQCLYVASCTHNPVPYTTKIRLLHRENLLCAGHLIKHFICYLISNTQ